MGGDGYFSLSELDTRFHEVSRLDSRMGWKAGRSSTSELCQHGLQVLHLPPQDRELSPLLIALGNKLRGETSLNNDRILFCKLGNLLFVIGLEYFHCLSVHLENDFLCNTRAEKVP